MEQRRFGKDGPLVGAVGLGCMSFAGAYGQATVEESHATLRAALELGITHIDTSNIYGAGRSEEIVGAFIKHHPGRFTIATKGGIALGPPRHFENSADYLRKELEGSLKRLGVEHVALYYIHRRDHRVPVEEVMDTLVRFKDEGKIGGIGFSEIAPYTLEQAAAIHPVMAVQNEYSLWTRQPELGLLQACERLGAALVAFSPVARGMLTDRPPQPEAFAQTDFRRSNPRFQEPNFSRNAAAVAKFVSFARHRGYSAAALAIAWTLAKGSHVIPIPGTRSADHLRQCAKAAEIALSPSDLAEVEAVLPVGFAHGPRYSDAQYAAIEHYC
ncbi:MAG: aldo/keto reductase [Rhizobiaceae bacterium]